MNIQLRKTMLGAAALVAGVLCSTASQAQGDRTIKLIVPFPPGGGTDVLARVLSRRLESDLGETVIVENRPGAGGNIAHDYVAAAAADGKTLLFTTNSLVINPLIYSNVKFNPLKSYTPVIALAHSPVVIVSKLNAPYSTLPEMLAYARANPGKLSYASCGNGGIHHLAGEQLKAMAGISMVHIPYRGCGGAMTDLAGGQVDISVNSLTAVAAFLNSGKVKGLAITNSQRSALVPALPTVASFGMKGYSFDGWYAVLAPAGTPDAAVQRLNASLNKALTNDEVKKTLLAGFLEPLGGPPSALTSLMTREMADSAPIVKSAKITAE
ncbi:MULTISPECIES: Bug family tripartite tricarboxylate transporter substrate binding protein [Polaromonas]|uniref:Bug family tripartite tricarboxylate transporter substrate binding protein n=1 Tax=Polaromonas aquatica TaxID=332657 RepID=A0ABW1U5M2_9BURK